MRFDLPPLIWEQPPGKSENSFCGEAQDSLVAIQAPEAY